MPLYLFEYQIFGDSSDMDIVPAISSTCTADSVQDASSKIMAYLQSVRKGEDCAIEKNEDVIDITFVVTGTCVRLLGVKETTPEEVYAHLDITREVAA